MNLHTHTHKSKRCWHKIPFEDECFKCEYVCINKKQKNPLEFSFCFVCIAYERKESHTKLKIRNFLFCLFTCTHIHTKMCIYSFCLLKKWTFFNVSYKSSQNFHRIPPQFLFSIFLKRYNFLPIQISIYFSHSHTYIFFISFQNNDNFLIFLSLSLIALL